MADVSPIFLMALTTLSTGLVVAVHQLVSVQKALRKGTASAFARRRLR